MESLLKILPHTLKPSASCQLSREIFLNTQSQVITFHSKPEPDINSIDLIEIQDPKPY